MLGPGCHVHLVGIGGSGMSGLAELLLRQGYRVSGSDIAVTPATSRLAALGARVYHGHAAEQVAGADLVAYSSAIRHDNPELVEARRLGIPLIRRGGLLAELLRERVGIAIAGAHGKTTTTSMIAFVLEQAGLDPTAVIGARFGPFGSGMRIGEGPHMVVEADESDRSFLDLAPVVAVITNIDVEHLESYGSFEALCDAFVAFGDRVPANGTVIACLEDRDLRSILPRVARRVITYGLDVPGADVLGSAVRLERFAGECVVRLSPRVVDLSAAEYPALRPLAVEGRLHLQVPGRHNLQNALAAVAACLFCGVSLDRSVRALADFRGADRRLDRRGEIDGVLVIDDYGHHPTEIAAVVRSVRGMADGRVLVAFQPHRHSRTKQLLDRFGPALSSADAVWLTDIYPAGEEPIPGITIETLAEAVRRSTAAPVHVIPDLHDLAGVIARTARSGDVILTIGAGSIGTVADDIVRELTRLRGSWGDKV